MKKNIIKLTLIFIIVLASIFVDNKNHFYITADNDGLYKVKFDEFR